MRALPRLHLLVADDNPLDRTLMAAYAESLGWSAVLVNDGGAALASARYERFDAVVFDQNMPVMTGVEAIGRIRQEHGPNRDVPALIWTSGDVARVRATAAAEPKVEVLAKPLRRATLLGWAARSAARAERDDAAD